MASALNAVFGFLLICLLLAGALAVFAVMLYNGLVQGRNGWKNAFAQIDVQLQRRFDLIPNLVETAKTYLAHERQTLEAVTAARNQAQAGLAAARQNPGSSAAMDKLAAGSGLLDGVLGRLMAVVEAYPELKANQNMMQLTEELSSTENRVAFARQAYNDSVMDYNNRCESFPSNLIAGAFRFALAAPLQVSTEQRAQMEQAPKVAF